MAYGIIRGGSPDWDEYGARMRCYQEYEKYEGTTPKTKFGKQGLLKGKSLLSSS
jgi:hypothetical protein